MLKIYQSFAGCNPNNKSLKVSNDRVYYLSSSNIVISTCDKVENVLYFHEILNCVDSMEGVIISGDIKGNAYVITEGRILNFSFSSKIQDCQLISKEQAVFCTLNSIYLVDITNNTKIQMDVDYMICSISIINSCIFVGSIVGTLYIYNIESNYLKLKEQIDAHLDLIKCIRKSESNLFATCSQDFNVKIWNFENNEISLVQTLNGHSDWVNSIFWNNEILYSASSDKTVRVWEKNPNQSSTDAENSFYICTDILGAASEIMNVSVINDTLIAQMKTGGIDKIRTNEYFLSGHQGEIKDLDWKNDLLLTCSQDKTSRIFLDGREHARPQTHGFSLTSVKFLNTEKLRFISSGQETILRIYEATQDFLEKCMDASDMETREQIDLYLDSKDSYSVSAYLSELNLTNELSDEPVNEKLSENYLSTHVFKEFKKIYGHFFEIKDIAVCSKLILSCNRSAAKRFAGLFVWSSEGEKLQYIEEHDLGIQKISISPCEKYALTVGRDKLVCLYSIENTQLNCINRFYNHERIVFDCGFSKDSKYFATCSRDGKVILYDTELQKIHKMKQFDFEITSICFNPVESELVVGNECGEIFLMDYDLEIKETLKVVSGKINILRYNHRGNKIAIGGSDNLLRIAKKED